MGRMRGISAVDVAVSLPRTSLVLDRGNLLAVRTSPRPSSP